ncbi:MAG: hypothetical protein NT014_07200 [Candidatus Omnitrophica bacterium]|nr:hypothetical protein [Candidatus Omnitrophota bacterium]
MIEKIIHKNIIIALIIYKSHKQDGVEFFSSNEYLLQLGYMMRPKGYQIVPHIHNPVCRNTIGTQEVLFIKSGEIRIDFYSFKKVFLESRKLSAGDIILLAGAGHGIEVLKKAEIVEVKNGPFIEGADKGRFMGKKGKK